MHNLRQIKRDTWPELINEIAEVVGDEAAMTLFIRFAGRHIRIPMKANPDHLLDKTIGSEKANLLRKRFSNELITIPSGRLLLMKIRNRQIMEDWKGGLFQCELATKYQLTERQINDIIARQKGAKPGELTSN